jgi:tRNA A37 threonylcarbamoyladenosine modification protein TsaB
MYLFLNAVSKNSILILFDVDRKIIDLENISILLQESSKLSPLIDNFLKKNNISYNEIENLVVVN